MYFTTQPSHAEGIMLQGKVISSRAKMVNFASPNFDQETAQREREAREKEAAARQQERETLEEARAREAQQTRELQARTGSVCVCAYNMSCQIGVRNALMAL